MSIYRRDKSSHYDFVYKGHRADQSWHAEARRTEEPGAGKLHAGIWAGAVGQPAVLPR
jgi:hypothetical protein